MERLFTIGAYGFDQETFFDALSGAGVDALLDVRRRRGVRGREYAFVNATRLQRELEARGIAYRHLLDLAPQQVTRDLQSRADAADKVAKRQRTGLAAEFVADYTERTLEPFDWARLAGELREFRRPALFCVERLPESCHRGLSAVRLAAAGGVPVEHLVP
jgi:uncharacterized protein (DUF488 family)